MEFFTSLFSILPSTLTEGLIWGILAVGVYLSYRVLDIPDMTVDGSLALGAVVSAVLTVMGVNAFVTIPIAILAGMLAGMITALLHTKLKIPAILAGILTMFALYSINIKILGGKASQSLLGHQYIRVILNQWLGIPVNYSNMILSAVFVAAVVGILYWFFGTRLGSSVRATGCNVDMARSQGINTDNMKMIGLAIGNGLAALAGCLLAQTNGSADVNMASGTIVIGLASVVIGDVFFGEKLPFWLKLIGAVVGSIIYRTLIASALLLGMPSTDLKLVAAILVALALSMPLINNAIQRNKKRKISKTTNGGDNSVKS